MFGLDLRPRPGEPMYPRQDVPSYVGESFYVVWIIVSIALMLGLPGCLLYLLVKSL